MQGRRTCLNDIRVCCRRARKVPRNLAANGAPRRSRRLQRQGSWRRRAAAGAPAAASARGWRTARGRAATGCENPLWGYVLTSSHKAGACSQLARTAGEWRAAVHTSGLVQCVRNVNCAAGGCSLLMAVALQYYFTCNHMEFITQQMLHRSCMNMYLTHCVHVPFEQPLQSHFLTYIKSS